MKNYSHYDKDVKKYIKNFKLIDNEIIVKTVANGSFKLARTELNETYFLAKMEEEALDVLGLHIEDNLEKEAGRMKILSTITIAGSLYNISSHMLGGNYSTAAFVLSAIGAVGAIGTYLDVKYKEEDIEKMRLFLSRKGDFQVKPDARVSEINGLSKKAIASINEVNTNESVMDINRLHNCSYNDLVLLHQNLIQQNEEIKVKTLAAK